MRTFEIADLALARKCKQAMYQGMPRRLTLENQSVFGIVVVVKDVFEHPPKWSVTLKPVNEKT